MAQRFKSLEESHIGFIRQQQLFFVGTAGVEGTVNVSPKGLDTFGKAFVTPPGDTRWKELYSLFADSLMNDFPFCNSPGQGIFPVS